MTTLDTAQISLLRRLSDADLAYKSEVLTAYAKARAAATLKIDTARNVRDALAAQCEAAGIPVLRIAEDGLHTTNTKTARAAIAKGAGNL